MSTDGAGSSSELGGTVSAIIACHRVNGALENAWNFLAEPKTNEKSAEVDSANHALGTAGVSGRPAMEDAETGKTPLGRGWILRDFQSWGCFVTCSTESSLSGNGAIGEALRRTDCHFLFPVPFSTASDPDVWVQSSMVTGVYVSSHRGPQLKRAVRPLSIFRETSAAACGRFANIVNCIPLSQNFGSLQFSAGPAQWSHDGTGTRRARALRIQSARITLPGPRLCHYAGRFGLHQSIAPVIQCSRCDRSALFTKLLQCFHASVEVRSVVRRMVKCKFGSCFAK